MSLSCPRCGNSIEQDFGMITCGQCQTILFIDMEGQIQVAGDESASAPVATASQMTMQPDSEPVVADPELGAVEYQTAQPESVEPAVQSSEDFSATPVESAVPSYDSAAEAPQVATEAPAYFGEGSTAGMPANEAVNSISEPQPSLNSSEVFSEVSEFGNNKQDFGALSYTLHIENIDTGEIRQKLAEALTDSKFQWDVNELLQKIEKGRLEIAQINPVKASILVHRLQEVPVRVSWDQKLL